VAFNETGSHDRSGQSSGLYALGLGNLTLSHF
jgi:hypothetical protein